VGLKKSASGGDLGIKKRTTQARKVVLKNSPKKKSEYEGRAPERNWTRLNAKRRPSWGTSFLGMAAQGPKVRLEKEASPKPRGHGGKKKGEESRNTPEWGGRTAGGGWKCRDPRKHIFVVPAKRAVQPHIPKRLERGNQGKASTVKHNKSKQLLCGSKPRGEE